MKRPKWRAWLRRYGFAELISFVVGVILTSLSYLAAGSIIGSAFFGSIAETAVFYAAIAYRDLRERKRRDGHGFGALGVLKVMRNMVLEFGPAEYLDTFAIRPLYFSIFPLFIVSYPAAIALATIAADISFFIPVIYSYELRKKYLRD